MGLILRSLRSLFSSGRAFRLPLQGDQVLDGVSQPIETLKTTAREVIDESWPGTATDTLPQWHSTLGVQYDPLARSVADQQTMLAAMETAIGGNTLELLQAQFDKEFDGRIVVSEAFVTGVTGFAYCGLARCGLATPIIYSLGYNITGTVYSITEARRVAAIIARYGPAHLTPNSLLTDPGAVVVGITGLGITGLARTGRAS
jgi:hypothetical protein